MTHLKITERHMFRTLLELDIIAAKFWCNSVLHCVECCYGYCIRCTLQCIW